MSFVPRITQRSPIRWLKDW